MYFRNAGTKNSKWNFVQHILLQKDTFDAHAN